MFTTITFESDRLLYQQLYDQLRSAILSGKLFAGERLPATRQLASDLGIGRITVKTAYDMLTDEGFVETRRGAGSYVAELGLKKGDNFQRKQDAVEPGLSNWATRAVNTRRTPSNASKGLEIDFGFGRTFPHIFPYDTWRKLLARYLSTDDTLLERYGSAAGFAPLRNELASYLHRVRGVRCDADQIVIVNGVQQAIDIVCRLFVEAGDEVIVENPGYIEAYRVLQVYGARLRPIAVDEDGLPVDQLLTHSGAAASRARLAFVTPANQFPRGGTLPLARRLALLRWAQANDAWILEDDYDSELRYDGQQISALQSIDNNGRVIYLGTFSKVLFPALQLAYLELPKPLVEPFLAAKHLIDRGSATLMQAAITDFIREGHFERHLRRLRASYGERHGLLSDALDRHLPDLVRGRTAAGLHILLQLPAGMSEMAVVKSAEKQNVAVYPAAPYSIDPANTPPALMLAFSGIKPELIEPGIERLAAVIAKLS